jgi:hypothetical protein
VERIDELTFVLDKHGVNAAKIGGWVVWGRCECGIERTCASIEQLKKLIHRAHLNLRLVTPNDAKIEKIASIGYITFATAVRHVDLTGGPIPRVLQELPPEFQDAWRLTATRLENVVSLGLIDSGLL